MREVIQRPEMLTATLDLGGGAPLELADYATTGLLAAERVNDFETPGLLI